ncbi:carbonic anhydrase [Corynebacterium sp. 320]|uniref:Carbonic anhydrase n=2 Tax=Corynebacteriaceae TaxID=1653 RepID=A0ABQ6VC88_9CORY|nr:carbonic anhydrase [Corynebacterium sp. 320]KAB1551104.1 carbonic anhydrase [Corynebacterium sp. 319]KAB3519836.1 carbonic anhydrase [Corynebacterium zhongnanshanii]KAB3526841.1 carbonic anhydrase [Corynebacterium sp. 250]KAB3538334.1 carbonic anhydrase [Corynebacterium sp. 366]MCR5914769.1 carbonic anhydrase [Corynebacterium sp. zg254]
MIIMNTAQYDTPQHAWAALMDGNQRFVDAQLQHPNLDESRRRILTEEGQAPHAAVLACSDSRVPVEIVFDQGLGDMFVVRNAGHLSGLSILASIEFAVDALQVPLIVVMGHQYCGAIAATDRALTEGKIPSGFQNLLVEKVAISVLKAKADGHTTREAYERYHVAESVGQLVSRSMVVRDAVRDGRLGVVGTHYDLKTGRVEPVLSYGVAIDGVDCREL